MRIARAARAAIGAAARAAAPEEACGCLLGTGAGDPAALRVLRAEPARNVAPKPRDERFELDPGAIVRSVDAARAAGLELVGFWHSHPRAPARPSAADRAGAWPGFLTLVLALEADELRGWLDGPAGPLELALRPDP